MSTWIETNHFSSTGLLHSRLSADHHFYPHDHPAADHLRLDDHRLKDHPRHVQLHHADQVEHHDGHCLCRHLINDPLIIGHHQRPTGAYHPTTTAPAKEPGPAAAATTAQSQGDALPQLTAQEWKGKEWQQQGGHPAAVHLHERQFGGGRPVHSRLQRHQQGVLQGGGGGHFGCARQVHLRMSTWLRATTVGRQLSR